MPPLLRCAGRPHSADSRPLRCPLDGRAGDVRMSDHRRYRPTSDEEDEFWRRLREVMVGALQEIGAEQPAIGLVVAEQLDRGNWRLMTRADLDADDQPDLATLWYRVDVRWCGEWVE